MRGNEQSAALDVERLLQFALQQGMLDEYDAVAARNGLLDLLQISEPSETPAPSERLDSPVPVLEKLLDYAAETGLLPENTTTRRDLLDARIMGLLMPRPSEVIGRFRELTGSKGIEAATDWYYRLSTVSNYIRMDRIAKNVYWSTDTPYGELEITINLSKPEKDPKEIAAERSAPQSSYPKCLLCPENVGYAGRLNHPARQNHRIIPVELDRQPWFLQYSPYVYYNEHCIVFSREHEPMRIHEGTFAKLLDFTSKHPHYFVGSNADLPIVGGSILSHDHFQGGRHVFAMAKAPVEAVFTHPDYPGIKAGIVRWPMSVLRISGHDSGSLCGMAAHILKQWRAYSDPDAGVLAFTEEGGQQIPHNTITPIARRNGQGELELDLVLRNNRTSPEHPEGIYHPHRDLHHIKKENIGLIEVMGLAVLPGRLKQELDEIRAILAAGPAAAGADQSWREADGHPLGKHAEWVAQMIEKYGVSLTNSEAEQVLRTEVSNKFLRVLEDAGVYKCTGEGRTAFRRFAARLGLRD